MIRPHMEYGDFIVDSVHQSLINKLEKLKQRTLRLIEYQNIKENRMERCQI